MIVYEATHGKFTEDVFSNAIEARILDSFQQRRSRVLNQSLCHLKEAFLEAGSTLKHPALA